MRYNSTETRGGRFKSAPAVHQSYTVPASVGGINALDSVTAMAPTDALVLQNLVPSEYGLRLRKGYRDWQTGYGAEVRTIIPFEGQVAGFASKRLFAVTENGIYDALVYGVTAPTLLVPFATPAIGSGFGVFTEFTNDASARFLFYADEFEGLHMYTESTDTWSVPTFTGVAAEDIAYVMVWKNRLWFIVRDSGDAYYLPPGAITGTATLFNFGAKLSHGGELKALFNWTIDGGAGVDDMLVALGAGGNVLVYQGTDPTSVETFSLVGGYFIGKCPKSRRLGVAYGGELYLLSMFGLISVRQLLEGVSYDDPSKGPSAKINRLLRDQVALWIESYVWRLTTYPTDGFLQVIEPYEVVARANANQLVQNLMTQAWGTWNGVPISCAAEWDGEYMMGTPDGRVIQYFGGEDEVTFDPVAFPGTAISYAVLTSYQAPGGDPSSYKRVGFVRPIQVTRFPVATNVGVQYDYNILVDIETPPPVQPQLGSVWDVALWDVATWSVLPSPESFVRGTLGQGRVVAIAMTGSSSARLTFVAWDVDYQIGGFL